MSSFIINSFNKYKSLFINTLYSLDKFIDVVEVIKHFYYIL